MAVISQTDLAESEAYKQCFYQVAGFFIVEHTVLGTAQSLLSKQWVDDLWDQAVREIARVMQQRLKVQFGGHFDVIFDRGCVPCDLYAGHTVLGGYGVVLPCVDRGALWPITVARSRPAPRRPQYVRSSG